MKWIEQKHKSSPYQPNRPVYRIVEETNTESFPFSLSIFISDALSITTISNVLDASGLLGIGDECGLLGDDKMRWVKIMSRQGDNKEKLQTCQSRRGWQGDRNKFAENEIGEFACNLNLSPLRKNKQCLISLQQQKTMGI